MLCCAVLCCALASVCAQKGAGSTEGNGADALRRRRHGGVPVRRAGGARFPAPAALRRRPARSLPLQTPHHPAPRRAPGVPRGQCAAARMPRLGAGVRRALVAPADAALRPSWLESPHLSDGMRPKLPHVRSRRRHPWRGRRCAAPGRCLPARAVARARLPPSASVEFAYPREHCTAKPAPANILTVAAEGSPLACARNRRPATTKSSNLPLLLSRRVARCQGRRGALA